MDRLKFTTNDGVTLDYLQAGDAGIPIVFLHGITAGAATYDQLGDALSAKHRVYALDFRGHGGSQKSGPPYTNQYYISDTVEFIRHVVGDEPIVLVGHSLGSIVAANIAADAAVPLRGTMLEDPPFFSGRPDGPGRDMVVTIFTAIQNFMKAHQSSDQSIEDLAALIAEGPAFGDLTKKNKDLVSAADIHIQAVLMHQCDSAVLDVITGDDDIGFIEPELYLPHIATPMHVLAGNAEKGAVISEEDFNRAVAMIPGASGALIASAGHLIHEHAPDRYRQELDGFLAKVCG